MNTRVTGIGNSNLMNDNMRVEQLNFVNRQCLVFVYITAIRVVCLDCIHVPCHTSIMEACHRNRI